jgi:hypothetical protein
LDEIFHRSKHSSFCSEPLIYKVQEILGSKYRRKSKTMVPCCCDEFVQQQHDLSSSNIFAQRYFDECSLLLRYLPLFNTMNDRTPRAACPSRFKATRQASSEEGRQNSGLLCSLRHTLPSSPTTSFSLLWRGVSLLYNPAKEQGCSPRPSQDKRCACLSLVGALELLSGSDWNGLFFWPEFRNRIIESRN